MTKNPSKGIIRSLAELATPQPPKHGYVPKSSGAPDRTVATAPKPQTDQGRAETRSFIDTYFTKATETQIIYNGDRQWARVTLMLETAGPVAIGTSQNIAPALSGKGQLLTTNVPQTFTVAKGSRLFVVSTGVNRVRRTVEAVPWLEQITGLVSALLGSK
jgi:hypothetical protein